MNRCPVCAITAKFRLSSPDWATDGTGTIPTVRRASRAGMVDVHRCCVSEWDHAHEHIADDQAHTRHYIDAAGIIRWRSNDRVPPEECLRLAEIDEPIRKRCAEVRDAETAEFLWQYRASAADVMDAEQLAEARAAFGPGERIVNVITGRVTQL